MEYLVNILFGPEGEDLIKGGIIAEARQTKITNQKQPITQRKNTTNKKDKKQKKMKNNKHLYKPAEIDYYRNLYNGEYNTGIIYYPTQPKPIY